MIKLKDLIHEGGDFVVCRECNKPMKQIQYRHLLYKHKMTINEYKEKYPDVILVSESAKNIGDKNPMKNEDTKKTHKQSVNTIEYKEKMSEALKGKNIGNVRTDNIERNKSKEFRKKISEGVKRSYDVNPILRELRSEIGKNHGFGSASLQERLYDINGWVRPEDKEPFALYTERVRRLSNSNYQTYFNEISEAKKRSRDFHLDHKYSISDGYKTNIPVEVISHYKNLQIIDGRVNESKGTKSSITLNELITDIQSSKNPLDNRTLLLCGGAYGHMAHPFDKEINLTFGQLKKIIDGALNGNLTFAREKTDGQALAVSWRDGKLVAARNKSHLKNKGEGALDVSAVASKFANRGGLTDAYNFAMKDLSSAIGSLSDKQRDKIFGGGSKFMNLEVIYPTSVNVIPYGQPLLIFHGTMEYDMDGTAIGEDKASARILAGMIKQVNGHVQSKYTITGPPVVQLPKTVDLKSKRGKYIGMLSKLQSEFRLKDSDGVVAYHKAWWSNYIDKNSPSPLSAEVKAGLVDRWAVGIKAFKLTAANLPDKKVLDWALKTDKEDLDKIEKTNLRKFEDIFLGVGAEVLSFMSSILAVDPQKAVRNMKDRLEQTIKDIQAGGDEAKIKKLKHELERLEAVGGVDKLSSAEGIVFTGPDGTTMKLTGQFAALNQILGLMYY